MIGYAPRREMDLAKLVVQPEDQSQAAAVGSFPQPLLSALLPFSATLLPSTGRHRGIAWLGYVRHTLYTL